MNRHLICEISIKTEKDKHVKIIEENFRGFLHDYPELEDLLDIRTSNSLLYLGNRKDYLKGKLQRTILSIYNGQRI